MVNKVILVGNVGKEVETRDVGGAKVAQFSLATSESWKDKTSGERKTKTEWHNIVIWRGLAEVAEKYVKKGQQLYLEGKIVNRSWDKEDGTKGYMTEIVCTEMKMLGSKGSEGSSTPNAGTSIPPAPTGEVDEELDLPF